MILSERCLTLILDDQHLVDDDGDIRCGWSPLLSSTSPLWSTTILTPSEKRCHPPSQHPRDPWYNRNHHHGSGEWCHSPDIIIVILGIIINIMVQVHGYDLAVDPEDGTRLYMGADDGVVIHGSTQVMLMVLMTIFMLSRYWYVWLWSFMWSWYWRYESFTIRQTTDQVQDSSNLKLRHLLLATL